MYESTMMMMIVMMMMMMMMMIKTLFKADADNVLWMKLILK